METRPAAAIVIAKKKCRNIAAFLFKKLTNLSKSECILNIKNAYIEKAKELPMLGVQTRDFVIF